MNSLRAPFPWFGGKSKAADLIWSRFGAADLGNYVEPFLGSAAVFLARPPEFTGWITLNDLDGHVVNFWRSITFSPAETALHAAQPVFECNLHARHLALVTGAAREAERLMASPQYHDPERAGWWAWGAAVWIGGGWCAGDGPWHAEPGEDGVPIFTIVLMHSTTSAELMRERYEGNPERAMYRTGHHSERGGAAYATARGIIRFAFKDGERITIKRPKRNGK